MNCPEDTARVLRTLLEEAKKHRPSFVADRLLLLGAVMDAENLLEEIESEIESALKAQEQAKK